MGTRADFYIGVGPKAEWLGSVAWDGDEWHENKDSTIAQAITETEFRTAVESLHDRDDFTKPEQGWPWPWEDSNTTDYAYCFNEGKVEAYSFGSPANDEDAPERNDWPDMSERKNVTFGKRSGIMIFRG